MRTLAVLLLLFALPAAAQECQRCEEYCLSRVNATALGVVDAIDIEIITLVIEDSTGLQLLENQVVEFRCAKGCPLIEVDVGERALVLLSAGDAEFVYRVAEDDTVSLFEQLTDGSLTAQGVTTTALANEEACLIETREHVDAAKCDEQLANCCACVRARDALPAGLALLPLLLLGWRRARQ